MKILGLSGSQEQAKAANIATSIKTVVDASMNPLASKPMELIPGPGMRTGELLLIRAGQE